jgi:RNA polymerase sigma factor (sigma-70 family)
MAGDASPAGRFPTTRLSVVAGLKAQDRATVERCFGRVAMAYQKPLYKHVRLKWQRSAEDARDLVQAFLAVSFEKEYLAAWDPARARFRTFLRTCIDRFVLRDIESARAGKRGGGARLVPLDLDMAEREIAGAVVPDAESVFEQEWARSVFEMALASLREELCGTEREIRFRVLEAYDLSAEEPRPSYQALAARFGIPVTTVTNHLHFARRELRRHVIETLRELTASEEELRAEVQALLGEAP